MSVTPQMWMRALAAGALCALTVKIVALPFEWMVALAALLAIVMLTLRGSAPRFVRPLSFWQTAPVVLCLVAGAAAGLLVMPFLLAAGKPLAYAYLVVAATALGLYQLFTTNRAIWFGLSEDRDGAPAARRTYVLTQSALVDGRVAQLARTNLWRGELVLLTGVAEAVERSAAGGGDPRAMRARDTRLALEQQRRLPLRLIDGEETPEIHARTRGAILLTAEPDEAERARAAGAEAIAIADLANVVNAIVHLDEVSGLPVGGAIRAGETAKVKLVKRGDQARQAIGHLDDGTPVAVDDAEPFLGQRVEVMIRSVRQLNHGRMAFGELAVRPSAEARPAPRAASPTGPRPAPRPAARQGAPGEAPRRPRRRSAPRPSGERSDPA